MMTARRSPVWDLRLSGVALGAVAVPSVNVRVRLQPGAGTGGSMCAAASANPG